MNAAFLIMSSAALAGADLAPPPPPHAAPIAVNGGAGCSNCGAPAVASYGGSCGDCCGGAKTGLMGHFKGRFGKKSHDHGCAPVPSCCAPAPAACCDAPCARPNLFDTLKSRWGAKHHRGSSCCNTYGGSACCDPCAGGYGAPVIGGPPMYPPGAYVPPGTAIPPGPGTGNTPPKEMPKPKDTTKPKEKGVSIPQPLPGTTVSGNSPY